MIQAAVNDFSAWRQQARQYLAAGISPDAVDWQANADMQQGLFHASLPVAGTKKTVPHVPKDFIGFAERIACHRDDIKWSLLYQALWRLTHGEPYLLKLATDPVIHKLRRMDGEIRRDAHKAKAFVRFRLLQERGEDHYIAWHRPDHRILSLVAPFFQRRFAVMRWSIFTPDESVAWDGEKIMTGPGVPASAVTHEDRFEDIWRIYYKSTFNPARIKVKMMKQEMPVRHWPTLPETRLIPQMLREAENRVQLMIEKQEGDLETAAHYLPPEADIRSLKQAAAGCKACPLHCTATQTVFGHGHPDADIMIVGEQPGDEEDRSGIPFTGPAGQVLQGLLREAGLNRDDVYITNAVKHFKFEMRNGQRIHQSPTSRNIIACKPWLETEIRLVRPKVIITLGVTAGRALVHHGFTLKDDKDRIHHFGDIPIVSTWHPSAVLRTPHMNAKKAMLTHIDDTLKRAILYR